MSVNIYEVLGKTMMEREVLRGQIGDILMVFNNVVNGDIDPKRIRIDVLGLTLEVLPVQQPAPVAGVVQSGGVLTGVILPDGSIGNTGDSVPPVMKQAGPADGQ